MITAELAVLIVEDEMILAMDIEAMVEDSGHRVVACAASLREVEHLDADVVPSLALVDMHLADETSGLDVSQLIQRRWPQALVVFVTANVSKIPADFSGADGVIPKPFSHAGVSATLRYLAQGIAAPPPTLPMPASFTASPALMSRWS